MPMVSSRLTFIEFRFRFWTPLVWLTLPRVSEVEKQLREAEENAMSFQALLETEAGRNQLIQGTITMVCDNLGVEPDVDTEEDVPGHSFMRQMAALGGCVCDQVRGTLHHGVKRALAVVRSGF